LQSAFNKLPGRLNRFVTTEKQENHALLGSQTTVKRGISKGMPHYADKCLLVSVFFDIFVTNKL